MVTPSAGAPTLEDIAVHLGVAPRFAGGCHKWWTVLHHSFVVEMIAMDILRDKRNAFRASVRPYALLHDAHEAVTADVPTPFKPEAMKQAQRDLDIRIWASFELPPPTKLYREAVEEADTRALLAEGAVMAHPSWLAVYKQTSPAAVWGNRYGHLRRDSDIVRSIHEAYPSPSFTWGPTSPAVQDFIGAVREALAAIA